MDQEFNDSVDEISEIVSRDQDAPEERPAPRERLDYDPIREGLPKGKNVKETAEAIESIGHKSDTPQREQPQQREQPTPQQQQALAVEQQLVEELRALDSEIKGTDWAALQRENKVEFLARRMDMNDRREALKARAVQIQALKHQYAQGKAQQQHSQLAQWAAQNRRELTSNIPGWSDPARAEREAQELMQHAVNRWGYTERQLQQPVVPRDAKFVEMAWKARQYDLGRAKGTGNKVRLKRPADKRAAEDRRHEAELDRRGIRDPHSVRAGAARIEGILRRAG